MKLRVERLGLLQQPIDQFLRAADGQRRNVVDRLFRIQLAALPAGMLERIDDVRADAQQAELENLEQAAGAGADDDGIGLDGAVDGAGTLSLKNRLQDHEPQFGARRFYTRAAVALDKGKRCPCRRPWRYDIQSYPAETEGLLTDNRPATASRLSVSRPSRISSSVRMIRSQPSATTATTATRLRDAVDAPPPGQRSRARPAPSATPQFPPRSERRA